LELIDFVGLVREVLPRDWPCFGRVSSYGRAAGFDLAKPFSAFQISSATA
jgi:hypothetical protein